MKDRSREELQELREELTEDLRQTDMEIISCNNIIEGSKNREVLENQRLIRLELIGNKAHIISQLREIKKNIKINNSENNQPNNYGDLMRENNAKLDKVILLLRKINKKIGTSKCSVE
jgi:hypothetical protein